MAGKLTEFDRCLSMFLRKIGKERSEICPPGESEPRLMFNIEALARTVWRMALGYKYLKRIGGKMVEEIRHPDKEMISLIFDRMEGKVAITNDPELGKQSLPDKISEVRKSRLNEFASAATVEDAVS